MGKLKEHFMEHINNQSIEDHADYDLFMQEAHYEHTISDVVGLALSYGLDSVLSEVKRRYDVASDVLGAV